MSTSNNPSISPPASHAGKKKPNPEPSPKRTQDQPFPPNTPHPIDPHSPAGTGDQPSPPEGADDGFPPFFGQCESISQGTDQTG